MAEGRGAEVRADGVPATPQWPGLQALRERGADRFDPVSFHVVAALARRGASRAGGLSPRLVARLERAAADLLERLAAAEALAAERLVQGVADHPESADLLRAAWDARDLPALARHLAALEVQGDRPLAELAAALGPAGNAGELRAARQFRRGWSRLRVDRHLSTAFAQAPANAGPLNSHLLVLQTLDWLRDAAPDYLDAFLGHAETLLWLEQAQAVLPGRGATGGGGKKRARSSGRSGKPG